MSAVPMKGWLLASGLAARWLAMGGFAIALLCLTACQSERAAAVPAAPRHPVPVADGARCRDCHAAEGDAGGSASPAPTWHALDLWGADFADCRPCHRPDAFAPAIFDHAAWPLTGRHRTPDPDAPVRCDRCHTAPLPADPDAAARCFDCHAEDRPAVSHGFVSQRCADCHDARGFGGGFAPARAVHPATLPLEGPHADRRCVACHLPALAGQRLRADCACCHSRDARGAAVAHLFPMRWRSPVGDETPADRTACAVDDTVEPGRDCDACHEDGFEGGAFAHDAWPLEGAHAAPRLVGGVALARCDGCHLDRAEPTPTACAECHRALGRAPGPPAGHRFGLSDCGRCHGALDWRVAGFDHAITGRVRLGTHAAQDCGVCHQATEGVGRVGCDGPGCHPGEHAAAQMPGHPARPDANCAAVGCHDPAAVRW